MNLTNSLSAWVESWQTVILGQGQGRVWPWYGFDSGLWGSPELLVVNSRWGILLNNPHSTYLAVLVESGVVGFAFLMGILIWLCSRAVDLFRHSRITIDLIVVIALLAVCAASVFEAYLVKNFGVSWWWWIAAFAVLSGTDPDLAHQSDQIPSP